MKGLAEVLAQELKEAQNALGEAEKLEKDLNERKAKRIAKK